MNRRALLTMTLGGTTALAGCNTSLSFREPRDAFNQTGRAMIRRLDRPFIQHGMDSSSDQYFYARLFTPGDSLPVTDEPDAQWYSDAVGELATDQFALLTNLRTAASAPAYFWPTDTKWENEQL